MGTRLLATAFGGVFLLAWGCGANVVVDAVSTGTGGSTTGNATSSSAGSTSSSGSGFTCTLLCGGPIGLCGCTGPCSDGKTRAVGCGGGAATGFTCTCSVDGQMVGMCNEPSLVCGLPGSCCEAIFGG